MPVTQRCYCLDGQTPCWAVKTQRGWSSHSPVGVETSKYLEAKALGYVGYQNTAGTMRTQSSFGHWWSRLPARLACMAITCLLPLGLGVPVMSQALSEAWEWDSLRKCLRVPWMQCANSGLLANLVIASRWKILSTGEENQVLYETDFSDFLQLVKKKKNVNSYPVRYYFMLLPLGFECYAEAIIQAISPQQGVKTAH